MSSCSWIIGENLIEIVCFTLCSSTRNFQQAWMMLSGKQKMICKCEKQSDIVIIIILCNFLYVWGSTIFQFLHSLFPLKVPSCRFVWTFNYILLIYCVPCYYFLKACRVYVRILLINSSSYVHETKNCKKSCIYLSSFFASNIFSICCYFLISSNRKMKIEDWEKEVKRKCYYSTKL